MLNRNVANDEEAVKLVYDHFTAITLMQRLLSLTHDDGVLAGRGNGDTSNYRLALS